jgi:hypothetical protein
MTDKERLENIALKAFKQHWAKIVRSLEKGKNIYANNRYGCFEADTSAKQKILANRFYGPDHARKMATLSEEVIKRNLSCYLPKAIEYALSWHEDEPHEQDAFMKILVSSEYAIFRSSQCTPIEFYDEDAADLWVAEYPAAVPYDDWYEGSIGANQICQTYVLMKSTGEDFLKAEVNWLRASIQQNIDSNEPDALWWFECEPLAKNKLLIKIYDFREVKEIYIEEFLSEAATLPKNQFQEFVRQTLEHLYKEDEIKKKLRVFNNYESMGKNDLLKVTENFFLRNCKVLDNIDIRIIEDAMNSIRGRKDRDYHGAISYA